MNPLGNSEGIVLLVQKIGPYHHARFHRAAQDRTLTVCEYRPHDGVYAWSEIREVGAYMRIAMQRGEKIETRLTTLQPATLICTGYSDPEIHRAMRWAVRRNVPMVVCSESTWGDEPRFPRREAMKRLLVGLFQAGFAGGTRAADYLKKLGVPRERVFTGWDAVDNDHFQRGADAARVESDAGRAKAGLPERYFLCVARFVPKKNLAGLLEAYARYVRASPEPAWHLVLAGAGELEGELRTQVERFQLGGVVSFRGFAQYPELPTLYGLAGAFVLPSTTEQWGLVVNEAMAAGLPVLVSERCGCAVDLVRPGENGFTFSPDDAAELAARLKEMAEMAPESRRAMGERSRQIVAAYSPAHFSRGLWAAVQAAGSAPVSREWCGRLVLFGLTRFRGREAGG